MVPLLRASGLTGPRGTTRIKEVDLTLDRHEIRQVVGPSGSGKTTLLRLLARLDPPDAGTLHLAGRRAEEIPLPEWRRRVGLVFQDPRLFPGTIEENLRWGALQHGFDVDPEALLDAVTLPLPLDRDVSGLSGGEAKRLQLARSLGVRPDVLLLDEPTTSLDATSREQIRGLIRRLADEGYGILMVSHLQEDRSDLPGDALIMEQGRLRPAAPEARH